MKAFIYYNLTSCKWSIKALEGPHKGLVVGHADKVQLGQSAFKVSSAGRQRVLKEQQKNVHAGVEGVVQKVHGFIAVQSGVKFEVGHIQPGLWSEQVTYNPYLYERFVLVNDKDTFILAASSVTMINRKVFIN